MIAANPTLWFRRLLADAPEVTSPKEPPRRRTGPVMMGDIHAHRNGTPMLLIQWEGWAREAKSDMSDDDRR